MPGKLRHLGTERHPHAEVACYYSPQKGAIDRSAVLNLTGQLADVALQQNSMLVESNGHCSGRRTAKRNGLFRVWTSPSKGRPTSLCPANAHNGRPKQAKTAASRGVGGGYGTRGTSTPTSRQTYGRNPSVEETMTRGATPSLARLRGRRATSSGAVDADLIHTCPPS